MTLEEFCIKYGDVSFGCIRSAWHTNNSKPSHVMYSKSLLDFFHSVDGNIKVICSDCIYNLMPHYAAVSSRPIKKHESVGRMTNLAVDTMFIPIEDISEDYLKTISVLES